MEQQNKYYTPKIEELFIGYELEAFYLQFPNNHWEKCIIDKSLFRTILYRGIVKNTIRTPYLSKEDIKSLEWKEDWNEYLFNKDKYTLNWGQIVLENERTIWVRIKNQFLETLYYGECKSINELRKIIKWLNIK